MYICYFALYVRSKIADVKHLIHPKLNELLISFPESRKESFDFDDEYYILCIDMLRVCKASVKHLRCLFALKRPKKVKEL